MAQADLFAGIEKALRDAVAAESFETAERMMQWYTLAAVQQLNGLEKDSRAALAVQARVNSLFEWVGQRTKAFRACAAGESVRLHSVTAYEQRPSYSQFGVSA
jgi:hypothetical protein